MKRKLVTLAVVLGFALHVNAIESEANGGSPLYNKVLSTVDMDIQSVKAVKFPVGPSATGIRTEITLGFEQACFQKEEVFRYQASENENGEVDLYAIAILSSYDRSGPVCMGFSYVEKTVSVPGLFRKSDINLVELKMPVTKMAKQFSQVFISDNFKITRAHMASRGTSVHGVGTIGCLDEMPYFAKAYRVNENESETVDVFAAPVILKHKDGLRVRCFAPNVKKFSFLLPDIDVKKSAISMQFVNLKESR